MKITEILNAYPVSEAEEIDEALNILELTIRLQTGFRAGFISEECFQRETEVNKDTHSRLNNEFFHKKQPILKMRFSNLVLATIGMVSCALDRALDKKFGNKDPEDHSVVGSTRSVVYMIRCAFAHDPCNPTWDCKGRYTKGTYTIIIDKSVSNRIRFEKNTSQILTFEFDFKKLNSMGLNFEHFNALDGFFLLSEHVQKMVSK